MAGSSPKNEEIWRFALAGTSCMSAAAGKIVK